MSNIKVDGHDGLFRDEKTQAIINTDVDGYNAYVSRRKRMIEEREKVENLENEVSELKNLIGKLIEKIDGQDSRRI